MAKQTKANIIGPELANIPWQDKPAGCGEVVWRHVANPIIARDAIPSANSIFNSAVVPFEGAFVGVFRCDDKRRFSNLHVGRSADGISWQIEHDPIKFISELPEVRFEYGYDPRVVLMDRRYYVTWCGGLGGQPTISMAWTDDFRKFHLMENLLLPYNRNGVLFPRKIGDNYAMLSRPSDPAHTPFGDIYYSESLDLTYWGRHRFVMGTSAGWQRTKVGPGPVPIETTEGWLMIYHGVLNTCNGFTYCVGAALLDIEKPWKVLHRTVSYILNPRELYECVGDVANVVFPVATLCDAATGRMAIYYGAADTVVALAYAQAD